MKTNSHIPILITGVERSGSTFIARILNMGGGYVGEVNKMYENHKLTKINIELIEKAKKPLILPETGKLETLADFEGIILKALRKPGKTPLKWLYKNATLSLLWPIWNKAFPDAKWIIVRRKTPDIINSCCKTGYMTLMKSDYKKVGVETESEGWLWLVHEYEKRWVEMIEAGLDMKEVWPDRMENDDYKQIKEILDWVGLEWNDKIQEIMRPIFLKKEGVK